MNCIGATVSKLDEFENSLEPIQLEILHSALKSISKQVESKAAKIGLADLASQSIEPEEIASLLNTCFPASNKQPSQSPPHCANQHLTSLVRQYSHYFQQEPAEAKDRALKNCFPESWTPNKNEMFDNKDFDFIAKQIHETLSCIASLSKSAPIEAFRAKDEVPSISSLCESIREQREAFQYDLECSQKFLKYAGEPDWKKLDEIIKMGNDFL
jgi:hypothetical protein